MSLIQEALTAYLKKQGNALGEKSHLRYSSDLDPEACERQIYYRLHGGERDAAKLGDELRFHGGRIFERTLYDSLRHAGQEVLTQVPVRPLRPSAWAWATGHADLVLPKERALLEVKAPRSSAFEWASGDPTQLVREGYRWQLSAYFHELKAQGLVDFAMWVFIDREGSHMPVEVELKGDLLIPLGKIVTQEDKRSALVYTETPLPDRLPRELSVSVLKTRGHAMTAVAKLPWRCNFCSFQQTCKPGPRETFHDLTPEQEKTVLAEAKGRWANGDQRVSVKLPPIPNNDAPGATRKPEAASPRADNPAPIPQASGSEPQGAASPSKEEAPVEW